MNATVAALTPAGVTVTVYRPLGNDPNLMTTDLVSLTLDPMALP